MNMDWAKRSPAALVGVCLALAALIFLFDLSHPRGVSSGSPYIALVLLGFWAPWWHFVYLLAGLASLFTVLDYYASADVGIPIWVVLFNRGLTLLIIWSAAMFCTLIKKNEGKFRAAIDHASDGIVNFDPVGIIESFNNGAERIFGYAQGEIVGQSIGVLIPIAHNAVHEQLIANFPDRGIAGMLNKVGLFQARHKNGKVFPIEVSVSPARQGAQLSYIGILRDISERVEAEERIQVLSRAIEQSPVSVVITDPQGIIEYVNAKFTETSGYAPVEVIGKNTNILKSLEARPDQYQELWETITSGKEWRGTFQNVNKNGDPYWESAVVSPIRNAEGAITHYLSVKEDITERLATEKQLAHALKLEATGQLTSGIAHDFNNILTIISGNLQLLMDEDAIRENADLKEILTDVLSAANDGAELVNRLLLLLRKNKPAASHVYVNRLLTNLRNLLARMLDKTIEVTVEVGRDVNTTFVDPYQLESAILNLAVNARDAMPAGGALRIESSLATVDAHNPAGNAVLRPGSYIAIKISDTGSGMDAEVLSHVLEPFYTTKAEGKGSGLGLSMVHAFAKRSGGEVRIESRPGAGTTITLYLPESTPQAEEQKGLPNPEYLPTGAETILVVEDNPNVRRFAVRTLKNLGYQVVETDNSDTAVEVLTRGDPAIDLLFSDIVIPGKNNGFSLASWVKSRDPRCRVLLTTGITPGLLDAQIDHDESFTLLRKPYTLERLAFAVRERLND